MVSMTFNELIESVINDLVNTGATFSAFTVTQKAREKLNTGEVTLSDRQKEQVFDYSIMSNTVTYFVSHDDVKTIVKSAMKHIINCGKYDKNAGKNFIEYEPVAALVAVPAAQNTPTQNIQTQNVVPTQNMVDIHTVRGHTRNGRWVNGYSRSNPKRS